MASRSARRRYVSPSAATAGRRTPSSSCRTACASISSDGIGQRGRKLRKAWLAQFEAYRDEHSRISPTQLERMQRRELPDGWDADCRVFAADAKGIATRDSSGKVLNAIASHYPWLIGGSADLAPSTKTRLTFEGAGDLEADKYGGRNLHFGIREHAMGAILNGLALSKIRAFGSTFLIFSDYMKPPIRLSALMELPVIYVFTHDSIGLGRGRPDASAGRAADRAARHSRPDHAAAGRRQRGRRGLARHHRAEASAGLPGAEPPAAPDLRPHALRLGRRRRAGAYVMADAEGGKPEVILIGTGSEVALCVEVYETLKQEGIAARVVSMPSWELFEQQDQAYRDSVLPPDVTARVSVEAGSVIGWDRYVGARRRQDRHAHLRRVGADQGPDDEIRLHAGEGARRRQGADCEVQKGRQHEPAESSSKHAVSRPGWII